MWQDYRRKRPNTLADSLTSRNGNELQYHIKRVCAELKIEDFSQIGEAAIISARIILNDLRPSSVTLFSEKPLLLNSDIYISIEAPQQFFIRGKVKWCHQVASEGNVITSTTYGYRAHLDFLFQSAEEIMHVKDYCNEVNALLFDLPNALGGVGTFRPQKEEKETEEVTPAPENLFATPNAQTEPATQVVQLSQHRKQTPASEAESIHDEKTMVDTRKKAA